LALVKLALLLLPIWFAACSDGPAAGRGGSGEAQALVTPAPPAVALAGRVTDAAAILDPAREARLAGRLERLERATGRQLVVVTVPSLSGREVADFTRDLANAWGIGRADEDDGVVFLVAPRERRARIEVGTGLETVLTDAACREILTRDVLPRFRSGDLAGGIEAGVAALVARLL
jgi:uncharacterized protein